MRIGSHYVACRLCVRTITMYVAWPGQHADRERPLLHQTLAIVDRSVHRQFANNRDTQYKQFGSLTTSRIAQVGSAYAVQHHASDLILDNVILFC